MKRILGGMVAAAALSGSAFATDLPAPAPLPRYTKAPAMAAPAYNWSGWYGGLNAGWVGGSDSVSNNASIVSTSTNPISSISTTPINSNAAVMAAGATSSAGASNSNAEVMAAGATSSAGASSGFIGGGQFGYNYQFSGSFVAGFEADIQGLTRTRNRSSSVISLLDNAVNVNSGDVENPQPGTPNFASVGTNSTTTRGLSYLGTLRARLGVLVAPSFLLYATGGLAYGGAKADTTIAQSVTNTSSPPPPTLTSGSFSQTRVGYAVGAGGEWMLSSNWSAKLEYLYYDLGSATYATGGLAIDAGSSLQGGVGTDAVATSTKVRFNDNIVRVGVNYHFGGPAASQY
jgi:outer membrane immunogenic protein